MSSLLVVLGLADEDTVSDDRAEEEQDWSSDLSDCGDSGPLSSLPSKFYNMEISIAVCAVT